MVGLECAFPVLYTELVKTGKVPLEVILNALCVNPRRIFSLPGGEIAEGQPADLAVLALDCEPHLVAPERFRSLGRATPFEGRTMDAAVYMTICGGKIVHELESVVVARAAAEGIVWGYDRRSGGKP